MEACGDLEVIRLVAILLLLDVVVGVTVNGIC